MSERELLEVQNHLQVFLEKGWIQPSTSQYNHPISFICKKTGELRVYIDYKSLNNNNIIDKHPVPYIDNTLETLEYAKIFSKNNLASGYHQVEMYHDHYHKAAFYTKFGLLRYVVMPLGLRNAPRTF